MTRVIHTGDTHIGYRQYHSPERRDDFLDAFEQVVTDAVEGSSTGQPESQSDSGDAADGGVDAVVHAGDLFHDRRPELPDLMGTLSVLRTLSDAGVPFLAVVGNHESTRGGQWLDLFESLGLATRLGASPVVVGDTAFYGLDHVPRSRRDDLDYRFDPHDADHAALVSHGLFTPFAHADWDTETVLSESNVDFDAVLLGDNHAADTEIVMDTRVTYCGSTERVSASERDGRGYNIVTFDGDVDVRRRALDTRPFVFVSVSLGEGEGVERVRERVRQHDLTDAVVIVEIEGEGDPVTPASVEEFALDRGALVARVTDRREREAESDVSVSFADPDDAVRERIEGMGLSAAARDVDETVRASKVADTNVRETVRTRVEDRLDDGLDGFEPAPEADADTDGADGTEESDAASGVTDSEAATSGDAPARAANGGASTDETSPDETAAAETTGDTPDGAEETDAGDADGEATDDDAGSVDDAGGGSSDDDGQVSMEDFL